ncbi:thiamine-phosphate kinase [uncultured Alistipes sp.]|uniref:thiamine-phosphate kinase n=1 Tax=uncultured Alistipes sp. TaxID=538949 RepID=UPI00261F6584|nr:thiamine-phosphate kinase [uncultured Alistipes sp.]
MKNEHRTEIATLGEFGLIDRICKPFVARNPTTVEGCGDDAAVIDAGDRYLLLSTDLMLEGVDFDLTYFPLQHLGYKSVVRGISDILAMNGTPRQIMLSLGISSRFSVEMIDAFYEGVRAACERYGTDLAGGDTNASINGLTIGITAAGDVAKDRIAYRSGAQATDLICLTGDLGAAYMGLHLLEREKRACKGHPAPEPQFEGHEYILQRQLRPEARTDIVAALAENGIVPTSMIDLSDGLASEILHLCKRSDKGARIYLNRLPIAKETYAMAEELNSDPVVAALNGGDDHELLFTVPLSKQDEIFGMGIDVIGHITEAGTGARLITPDGQEIAIRAQGWK